MTVYVNLDSTMHIDGRRCEDKSLYKHVSKTYFFSLIIIIWGSAAMSQDCSPHTVDIVRGHIERLEYNSAVEALRSNSSDFLERSISTPESEVLAFLSNCQKDKSAKTKFGFLFELDSSSNPIGGELNLFLNGDESFEDYPFSAQNFVSEKSAFTAASRYVDGYVGNSDTIVSSIQDRGFFIHSDYIDAEGQRRVVFVRSPYEKNSLMDRIGGNRSPNTPASFCLVLPLQISDNVGVKRTSECQFDWNSYVQQANDFLEGDH